MSHRDWDATRVAETRQFLSFIWAEQSGFFELDRRPDRRQLWSREEALANIQGSTLFAPLARARKGSTKRDVAKVGNVLWVDIDSRDAPQLIQERLLPLGLQPSVFVDSGNKGHWVYFKLTDAVPTDEVEALNRGLAQLLEADHCGNRDRIARLPNSLHPKSEKFARIVDFSGISYSLEAFKDISRVEERGIDVSEDSHATGDQPVRLTAFGEFPALGPRLWRYIRSSPKWDRAAYDRSAVEYQIFLALAAQGWSDKQIIAFADAYRLPRHREERLRDKRLDRTSYAWTYRSITKACNQLSNGQVAPRPTSKDLSPMCIEPVTRQPFLDRYEVLPLVRGQCTGTLVAEVIARFGCVRKTVFDALRQLEAGKFIEREKSGRNTHVHLTQKGRKLLASRFRRGLFLPTLESLRTGSDAKRGW